MQIQMTTDYAMRIIAHMLTGGAVSENHLLKARSMAETLGIDYQYSMKIINKLKKGRVIRSVQGCTGGYYLDPAVKGMTFYDIIKLMEGEIHLLHCLEDDDCTREKIIECPVKCEFEKLQNSFVEKLKEINITEVCRNGF